MEERKNVKITEKLLQEYREYLLDEERSTATVEKYLRDVKKFQIYLEGSGRLIRNKSGSISRY